MLGFVSLQRVVDGLELVQHIVFSLTLSDRGHDEKVHNRHYRERQRKEQESAAELGAAPG
jgi:hypothetical protein